MRARDTLVRLLLGERVVADDAHHMISSNERAGRNRSRGVTLCTRRSTSRPEDRRGRTNSICAGLRLVIDRRHSRVRHPAGGLDRLSLGTAAGAPASIRLARLGRGIGGPGRWPACSKSLGEKIPLVDHGLQAIHTVAKPLAGALIAGAVVSPENDPARFFSACSAGRTRLAIHGVSATARAASTATTAGLANPIVSVVEDVLAIGGILLGWFLPFLTAALIFAATIVGLICVRRLLAYLAAHRERRAVAEALA